MTDHQSMTLQSERVDRFDVVADSPRKRRSFSTALRRVAIGGAIASAVLYSNWLLELVFAQMLPDPDEFISELAAADQPHYEWFRMGDRITALVVTIAAVAALVSVRGGRWHKMGWWAVIAFAVGTVLDSTVWTMVCAPHASAACMAADHAGTVPLGHQLHLLSSAIAVVASILSMIFFAVADHRDRKPARVRRFGWFVLAALIGTNVWTGIAAAVDEVDGSGLVGLAQQAELTAMALWLIYIALRTARSRTARASQLDSPAAQASTSDPDFLISELMAFDGQDVDVDTERRDQEPDSRLVPLG
jgi:hypothetical protein